MNRIAVRIAALFIPLVAVSWASAEVTVTVEKTHLCCKSCVTDAGKAVKSAGATPKCDPKAGTVTITAADEATAQKAVDALVAAGFYGKATGATIKDDSGAPAGKATSVTVSGIHNCCGKCTKAIEKAIAEVPGAKATLKPHDTSFTVTGDFDAGKLVSALNDAGFSVKVSK